MNLTILKKLFPGHGKDAFDGRKGWRPPLQLDHGPIPDVSLTLDRNGRGLAVWEHSGRIWTQALGPAHPIPEQSLPLGQGLEPKVFTNLDGRGIVLWIEDEGFERAIHGLPFDPGSPVRHSSRCLFRTEGQIRHLQASVDRRGGVLALWSNELDGVWEVRTQSFDIRQQAWNTESERLGEPASHPLEPVLAVNRKGKAAVLWQEDSAPPARLQVFHYLPSMKAWSDHPTVIAEGTFPEFRMTMDHLGNLLALWVDTRGSRPRLWARTYLSAPSEWLEPQGLASAGRLQQLRLAMTGTGDALALWLHGEGSSPAVLHSKAYRQEAWDEEVTRLDTESGRIEDPTLALGPRGHAAILYVLRASDGDALIFRERRKEWAPSLRVATEPAAPLSRPRLALCPKGLVAVWCKGAGRATAIQTTQRV